MNDTYTLAGINGREARKAAFKSKEFDKIAKPKSKAYTTSLNGKQFTVNFKAGTGMGQALNAMLENYCYDPAVAEQHMIDEKTYILKLDPQMHTYDALGGMYLDPDVKIDELPRDEVLDRLAAFIAVCTRCAGDDVLQVILENAPKKKDGTLAKNRVFRIAAFDVICGTDMTYYMLRAAAKDDLTLDVTVKSETFAPEKQMLSLKNEILSFIENGKRQKAAKPNGDIPITIKISDRIWSSKITLEVPAIKRADGQIVLSSNPQKPISEFKCISGNEKKGYTIVHPEFPKPETVISGGQAIEVYYDNKNDNPEFGWMKNLQDYLKKGKYKKEAVVFVTGRYTTTEVYPRALTDEYISEFIYHHLTLTDSIGEMVADPELFQRVADNARRNKDGTLHPYWVDPNRFEVEPDVKRKVPILKAALSFTNYEDQEISGHVVWKMEKDDLWTTD